jgi:N-acetylglucosaminyl-diphospho-decaprenol L-rhamnosyltransferase
VSQTRRVVALVVSFNNAQTIRDSLTSLIGHDEGRTAINVIVVDNASSDSSVEVAQQSESASLPVVVVRLEQNLGFAPAVNVGLTRVGAVDAILLLNPDARLEAGAVDTLLDTLLADDSVGAVGPRIVASDGSDELSALRADLGLWTLICELSGLRRLSGRWFGSYRCERWDRGVSRDAECLSGACMLIRAAAFHAVGRLDASVPMYFEDMDLCRRLRDDGWGLKYEAGARVIHTGAYSSGNSPVRRALKVMEEGDARWLFLRRHEGPMSAAAASAIIGVGSVWRLFILSFLSVFRHSDELTQRRIATKEKYRDLLIWSIRRPKPMHDNMPR